MIITGINHLAFITDDMEKTMISKLKADVGAQFTSKMEGMMNDLTTGLEHKKKFDDFHSKCEKTSPINFSVCPQLL